jgi:hypothetical protein
VAPDKLENAAAQTSALALSLRRLGASASDAPDDAAALKARAEEVDAALRRVESIVEEWKGDLEVLRQKLAAVAPRVPDWLRLGAIAAMLIAAWFVLAQLSLFVHAWRWLTGRSQP